MVLLPWVWGTESPTSCRDEMTMKIVIESQGETCSDLLKKVFNISSVHGNMEMCTKLREII